MKNYAAMTDKELVRLYEEGEDNAFDVLLNRNQDKLYNYIFFLTRDKSKSDDLFQDTFVRAITAIRSHRYTDTGSFSAWLIRIAHNLVLDMHRSNVNMPVVSHEFIGENGELKGDLFNDMRLSEPNVESLMLYNQSMEELRGFIDQLPDNQREMIFLHYYREMPFKEIAETLGISINTALGRAHYAVLNLRRMVAGRVLYTAV